MDKIIVVLKVDDKETKMLSLDSDGEVIAEHLRINRLFRPTARRIVRIFKVDEFGNVTHYRVLPSGDGNYTIQEVV